MPSLVPCCALFGGYPWGGGGPVLSEGSQKRSGSAGDWWWSGEGENWEEWKARKLQSGCMVQEKNKEGGLEKAH